MQMKITETSSKWSKYDKEWTNNSLTLVKILQKYANAANLINSDRGRTLPSRSVYVCVCVYRQWIPARTFACNEVQWNEKWNLSWLDDDFESVIKKTQKQIIHKIISLENESSLLNFDSPVSTIFFK